ncbi:histidine phosphatase family protein [Halomonas urumqiensis]|uniref:Histidine phosphatase family protein n=2 Tax=Halomonas urumqiensis TaxID=1684789 RepID=A0A2N7UKK3_9GAMM|nr:histidine phosphatase family protein [Halomonas urumqiensis]PTB02942.1 histidine phosphatase family protein [Halomonas urumqiensis]
MRHGHSQANARGVIASTPQHALQGFGLSPQGEAQLQALMENWHWPVPSLVLHSDFLRTTETAARVATHFGLAMQAETGLRERYFGTFEGEPDTRYAEVWALDANDPGHSEHGVESVARVAERMRGVIDAQERAHRDETILLVSHGDPLQILLTALADTPLTGHREREPLAPASITVLDATGGA